MESGEKRVVHETFNILSIVRQNKVLCALLAVLFMASGVMAVSNPAGIASSGIIISETKYVDEANPGNSITFYDDGTFYIEQSNGHDIAGTYFENSQAYGITYTKSGYGETLDKTASGVLVPDGNGKEEWFRV